MSRISQLWKGLSVEGTEIKDDELRKAFMIKKIAHDNLTIKSRILKLAHEEEKARKRIKDAERAKNFVNEMTDIRQKHRLMKNDHNKFTKDHE